MNILFVHPNNDFTGSTKVLSDVIKEKYANESISVLTLSFNEGFLSGIRQLKIKSIYFPLYKGRKIPIISSLVSLVDRILKFVINARQSDVIYINTIKPYYAAIIARMMHKKLIWHIHEKYTTGSVTQRFYECIQLHTDAHFIFVSKYVQDQYVISMKSTREIRYNKLSQDFLDKIVVRPPKERSRKNILMAASLSRAKGIYNYVELARMLPQYNFHLVLSCSENERDCFVQSVVPPANCTIWSKQKDMHNRYSEADVIMNMSIPSLWVETFGMTILEGMSYGLPAIVPNVGGQLEIVQDGIEGYSIDVCDFNVLRDTIYKITTDESKYIRLSKAALKKSYEFR